MYRNNKFKCKNVFTFQRKKDEARNHEAQITVGAVSVRYLGQLAVEMQAEVPLHNKAKA